METLHVNIERCEEYDDNSWKAVVADGHHSGEKVDYEDGEVIVGDEKFDKESVKILVENSDFDEIPSGHVLDGWKISP